MLDDDDQDPIEPKPDAHLTPAARAAEKVEELRLHSELAAAFEGPRKFDARLIPGLDADLARDVQRTIAKLERQKVDPTPVIGADGVADAARLLRLPEAGDLTTGDYHLYRRPGELMAVRWLVGDEVDTFYARYQAHVDAALGGARDDERSSLGWRGDEATTAYLAALDATEVRTADLYMRASIRRHGLFVLSTTAADEMNVRFLAGHLMGVGAADLVGEAAAPGEGASDRELAWFFKLFALRGVIDGVERMCLFTFMQKSDEDF